MSCASCSARASAKTAEMSQWVTLSVTHLAGLATTSQTALAASAAAAFGGAAAAARTAHGSPLAAALQELQALDANGVSTLLHVNSQGDAVVTSSVVGNGNGDITVHGAIGPIPFEAHLHVQFDNTRLTLTV